MGVVAVYAHAGHVEFALRMRVHALVREFAVGERLARRRWMIVLTELLCAVWMIFAALLGFVHLQHGGIHANCAH